LNNSDAVSKNDDSVSERAKRVKTVDKTDNQLSAADVYPISRENYQGLCVNCKDLKNCSRSDAEGGIWSCGEYCQDV
jgi:hypothetical protein